METIGLERGFKFRQPAAIGRTGGEHHHRGGTLPVAKNCEQLSGVREPAVGVVDDHQQGSTHRREPAPTGWIRQTLSEDPRIPALQPHPFSHFERQSGLARTADAVQYRNLMAARLQSPFTHVLQDDLFIAILELGQPVLRPGALQRAGGLLQCHEDLTQRLHTREGPRLEPVRPTRDRYHRQHPPLTRRQVGPGVTR